MNVINSRGGVIKKRATTYNGVIKGAKVGQGVQVRTCPNSCEITESSFDYKPSLKIENLTPERLQIGMRNVQESLKV